VSSRCARQRLTNDWQVYAYHGNYLHVMCLTFIDLQQISGTSRERGHLLDIGDRLSEAIGGGGRLRAATGGREAAMTTGMWSRRAERDTDRIELVHPGRCPSDKFTQGYWYCTNRTRAESRGGGSMARGSR
jgi:hypothetical protein